MHWLESVSCSKKKKKAIERRKITLIKVIKKKDLQ